MGGPKSAERTHSWIRIQPIRPGVPVGERTLREHRARTRDTMMVDTS